MIPFPVPVSVVDAGEGEVLVVMVPLEVSDVSDGNVADVDNEAVSLGKAVVDQ